jgi:peptidoglycan/xylan/chitin deacetylase (PgdA/CDA1 family)
MRHGFSYRLVRLADRLRPDVVFFGRTERNVVALTLDDGPHETVTADVLDLLAARKASATFFLIGSRAESVPKELMSRIVDEHHELGNHSWEDEFSAMVPEEKLKDRISRTHEVLRNFGEVRLFRPGKGWPTAKVRRALAKDREYRYQCVLGSVYPNDVRVSCDGKVIKRVLDQVHPGAIIILHEGTEYRARILPILDEVLRELDRRDYTVGTVSELLHLDSETGSPPT